MENIIDKLGWKKITAVSAILATILLILVILTFPSTPKESAGGVIVPSQFPKAENENSTGQPTQDQTKLVEYSNDIFTVSFPSEMSPSIGTVDNINTSLFLKSDTKSQNIQVQVYESSNNSVENLSLPFIQLGLAKSTITVAGVQGLKFKGTSDNFPGLQKTGVIFAARGKLFRIQFSYVSSAEDKVLDNNFVQLIDSFKLR